MLLVAKSLISILVITCTFFAVAFNGEFPFLPVHVTSIFRFYPTMECLIFYTEGFKPEAFGHKGLELTVGLLFYPLQIF